MLLCSSSQILFNIHESILNYVADINLNWSGYKFCHLGILQWDSTIAMVFFVYYISALYCHCISLLSEELCFGTVENSEHTKEFSLFIKDVNEYHFERLHKMALLILQLNNLYIIYNY